MFTIFTSKYMFLRATNFNNITKNGLLFNEAIKIQKSCQSRIIIYCSFNLISLCQWVVVVVVVVVVVASWSSSTSTSNITQWLTWRTLPWWSIFWVTEGRLSSFVPDHKSPETWSTCWWAQSTTIQSKALAATKIYYSHYKISRNIETVRCGLSVFRSIWYLTGVSAALLPRRLSNFRAIR